jgi:hypothetical protein
MHFSNGLYRSFLVTYGGNILVSVSQLENHIITWARIM